MTDWQPAGALGNAVWAAGFSYDDTQDIIFSRLDAIQRNFGYAYGYDRFALGINMVIDCEPIFFDYAGKHWMIELWKGQYGLQTGCEVGVYNRPITDSPEPVYSVLDRTLGARPNDPDPTHSLFFDCAGDAELLDMAATLRRKGQPVLSRGPEKHWWLTGFKWGLYSRPEDLTVDVSITLLDQEMRDAFVAALTKVGYTSAHVSGNTVTFVFGKPFAAQPRDATPDATTLALAADHQIVKAYAALRLPNNDPNQVGAEALQYVGVELIRLADAYCWQIAQAAASVVTDPSTIVSWLTSTFSVGASDAASWLSTAFADFAGWLTSIQAYFGWTLDRGCYVEVDNRAGAFDLVRTSASLESGNWGVNPPSWIPKGGIGRYVVRDAKLVLRGSGAKVEYSWGDAGLNANSASMECYDTMFGGYLNPNTASVSGSHFTMLVRTDPNADWSSTVPESGSPLHVRYTASS